MAPGESGARLGFFYVTFVFLLIVNIAINAVWVASAFSGLKDLDSFLHSGAAYARGLDPYEYYAWLNPPPISPQALNLNPPISIYFFEPLSGLDRGMLGAGFLAASLAMVGVSGGLLMRAYPDKRRWLLVLIVLSMAGLWQMLWYLQIYAPLLLAITGAWLLLRRGDWLLAGVLIGLVIAIKPNYALVALVLLAAGHYRPAVVACLTAGLVSLVPLLIDGTEIYGQWLHMTAAFEGYGWTSNASLVSFDQRLGIAPAGRLVSVAMVVGVLAFARQVRPAGLDAMALGILTVILVGPVSWAGYTLLLLPYLFSIRWDGWTWASVAILVMPFAPGRAFSALGIGLPGLFEGAGGSVSLALPESILGVAGSVFAPLVGALYAWAVLLLFVRLVKRLAAERDVVQTGRSIAGLRPSVEEHVGRLGRRSPSYAAIPMADGLPISSQPDGRGAKIGPAELVSASSGRQPWPRSWASDLVTTPASSTPTPKWRCE